MKTLTIIFLLYSYLSCSGLKNLHGGWTEMNQTSLTEMTTLLSKGDPNLVKVSAGYSQVVSGMKYILVIQQNNQADCTISFVYASWKKKDQVTLLEVPQGLTLSTGNPISPCSSDTQNVLTANLVSSTTETPSDELSNEYDSIETKDMDVQGGWSQMNEEDFVDFKKIFGNGGDEIVPLSGFKQVVTGLNYAVVINYKDEQCLLTVNYTAWEKEHPVTLLENKTSLLSLFYSKEHEYQLCPSKLEKTLLKLTVKRKPKRNNAIVGAWNNVSEQEIEKLSTALNLEALSKNIIGTPKKQVLLNSVYQVPIGDVGLEEPECVMVVMVKTKELLLTVVPNVQDNQLYANQVALNFSQTAPCSSELTEQVSTNMNQETAFDLFYQMPSVPIIREVRSKDNKLLGAWKEVNDKEANTLRDLVTKSNTNLNLLTALTRFTGQQEFLLVLAISETEFCSIYATIFTQNKNNPFYGFKSPNLNVNTKDFLTTVQPCEVNILKSFEDLALSLNKNSFLLI